MYCEGCQHLKSYHVAERGGCVQPVTPDGDMFMGNAGGTAVACGCKGHGALTMREKAARYDAMMENTTEDEYGVIAYRPKLGGILKNTFPNLGNALHSATGYANAHPDYIVTVAHRLVMRGEWGDGAPFDYSPPPKEGIDRRTGTRWVRGGN